MALRAYDLTGRDCKPLAATGKILSLERVSITGPMMGFKQTAGPWPVWVTCMRGAINIYIQLEAGDKTVSTALGPTLSHHALCI